MVDIRRVTPAEWQTLRRVRLAAMEDAPYAFGSTYERETAFTEQEWLGRIKRSAYFVARAVDDPIGLVGAFSPTDRPDAREIVSMWVEPDSRGGKLADQLLSTAMGWARDDGAGAVSLWVAEGNERARRFYVRYGFEPTGLRQPLWAQPGVDAYEYILGL
jgi:ribosomal protein S18 acetylase RimI-like enzyme